MPGGAAACEADQCVRLHMLDDFLHFLHVGDVIPVRHGLLVRGQLVPACGGDEALAVHHVDVLQRQQIVRDHMLARLCCRASEHIRDHMLARLCRRASRMQGLYR